MLRLYSGCDWMYLKLLVLLYVSVTSSAADQSLITSHWHGPPGLSFSSIWLSLGPFRIGTREAVWGADPLERHGGFPNLAYSNVTTYRSALAVNASVGWRVQNYRAISKARGVAAVSLRVAHPEVDWASLQQVYGWSALQYQTWLRGHLNNPSGRVQKILFETEGVLELFVNGEHFFGGDVYGFKRAPIVISLRPGHNKLDIRLIRDVRAMGGQLPPTIEAVLQAELVTAGLRIDTEHVIAPDLLHTTLTPSSPYMSFPVTNLHDEPIVIENCTADSSKSRPVLLWADNILIHPGQTRPIAFRLSDQMSVMVVRGSICYRIKSESPGIEQTRKYFRHILNIRSIDEPHKITFLHPSGIVSYALLQPPRVKTSATGSRPLLLLLHGAGVEADSSLVRHTLDGMPDLEAFALFPSGGSPWSADDWHIWGHADILAAINSLPQWMQRMNWNGSMISTERIVVAGHSNGGQGTWYFASHMPDRTLAAAPLSGYTSIENYVPYQFWTESDPLRSSIVSMSRLAFKNELFLENMADIPTLQQHGSLDNNVPPYHSRLMSSLRDALGARSDYVELAGKGHWFDGVVTTEPLRKFFKTHLSGEVGKIDVPSNFRIISTATPEMGSKFGIVVDQLLTPHSLGQIEIDYDPVAPVRWTLRTSNVRSLRFVKELLPGGVPCSVQFESQASVLDITSDAETVQFVRNNEGYWSLQDEVQPTERTGLQRGTIDAILRTTAPFHIIASEDSLPIALQTSRNLFQYYGADATISTQAQQRAAYSLTGNIITVSLANDSYTHDPLLRNFPLTFEHNRLCLRTTHAECHPIPYQKGLGAIFLRPRDGERLELVIWGHDREGLRSASRLMPMLTGVGQPDFIILGASTKWLGVQGTLALGFFDHGWNISQGAYLG